MTLSPAAELGIEELLTILEQIDRSSPFYKAVASFLDRRLVTGTAAAIDAAPWKIANPFDFFDAIYCINLDREKERWQISTKRFAKLGISDRVRRFPAVETPHNHHIGCALSHRAIIAEAKAQGLRNVLVFEDDVIFSLNALEELHGSIQELRGREWWTLYLGGCRWGGTYEKLRGCCHLRIPEGLTCAHALAYNAAVYDVILSEIPTTATEVALWARDWLAIDQLYSNSETFSGRHLLVDPIVATQGSILQRETRLFDEDASAI